MFELGKPVMVADAAMLSNESMQRLNEQGYRFIVVARLANTIARYCERMIAYRK